MTFELHNRLQEDTFFIGDLPLCRLLLMNDSRYPWVILVPRINAVCEIHQLDVESQKQLMTECCLMAEFIENNFAIEKMNVASLGNIVPQLHVHHIGRSKDDPAWPGPVWGHSAAIPYTEQQAKKQVGLFKKALPVG